MRNEIHKVSELFTPLLRQISQHYRQRIAYAPTDLETFYEDLDSECIIGLWKALIRFDLDKVGGSPPEAYIAKVIRSHVKEIPIGLLHVARIPQSKWKRLPDETRETLRYPTNNNKERDEDEINDEDIIIPVEFDLDTIEWQDFISKLHPVFRESLMSVAGEEESDIPLPVAKFLSLLALLCYRGR